MEAGGFMRHRSAPLDHEIRDNSCNSCLARARFWRNVTLIALAHVALIAGLIHWSVEARSSSNAQSIVWISGAEDLAAREPESNESPPPAITPIPPAESEPLEKGEAAEETTLVTAATSEIELPRPTATPEPTSTPRPTATPKPKPKATPTPTPKATLKKTLVAKASPKQSPKPKSSPTRSAEKTKKTDVNAEKKKVVKTAPAKTESSSQASGKTGSVGKGAHADGGSSASEFGWYGNMLHDRFYSAWIQPTTTVGSGAKISTLVKVRIEKDGRVSKFEIIKPSENVVVNESVAAVSKRVTEVDAPPDGLRDGDHYDVKINFELNTEQEASK
jgi:outer membrane biosynthesis protein TonB